MSVHKNLTGADLHEPKGADTALSGQVYVANGSGGGVWTDATSVITNTAFTTGDLKITHKTTADTSWVLWTEGTIGDGSSGATVRANADTSSLFTLYWGYAAADCPIYTSGGVASTRGASAAIDFAAHKRLSLPLGNARALMIAGTATGLTTRTLGNAVGAETRTLLTANLPAYTPSGTVSGSITGTAPANNTTAGNSGAPISVYSPVTGSALALSVTGTFSGTLTGTAQGGTSTAFSIIPPATGVNVMIKL